MKSLRCCALSLLLFAATARAQQAPAPVPFLRASVASIDAVNKLATDLGLPIPSLKTLIESFPFLGPDTLATDRPIGVISVVGPGIDLTTDAGMANMLIIAFPAAAGKLTLKSLADNGATPSKTNPDTVTMGDVQLRRTAGYLLMQGGKPVGLAAIKENPFAADYQDAATLAFGTFSMPAFRTGSPEAFKLFTDGFNAGLADATAGSRFGQDFAHHFLETLDTITYTVTRDEKNVRFVGTISPFTAQAPVPMPRPGFPAGTFAQVQFLRPADQANWIDGYIGAMPDQMFTGMTPDQIASLRQTMTRILKLFIGGDSVSVGVSFRDGQPIVYVVSHRAEDFNYAQESKTLGTQFTALLKLRGNADTPITDYTGFSTYDANGKSVTRLSLQPKGSPPVALDTIQSGKTLYAAFGPLDAKLVADLANAPPQDNSTAIFSAEVNLEEFLSVATQPQNLLAGMPPEMKKQLAAAFAGQSINVSLTPDEPNKQFRLDLQLPIAPAKALLQLLMHTN